MSASISEEKIEIKQCAVCDGSAVGGGNIWNRNSKSFQTKSSHQEWIRVRQFQNDDRSEMLGEYFMFGLHNYTKTDKRGRERNIEKKRMKTQSAYERFVLILYKYTQSPFDIRRGRQPKGKESSYVWLGIIIIVAATIAAVSTKGKRRKRRRRRRERKTEPERSVIITVVSIKRGGRQTDSFAVCTPPAVVLAVVLPFVLLSLLLFLCCSLFLPRITTQVAKRLRRRTFRLASFFIIDTRNRESERKDSGVSQWPASGTGQSPFTRSLFTTERLTKE
jgi:hypothetical protein